MVKADIRIHNVVYECAGCGDLKVVDEDPPLAILRLNGIKPKGEGNSEYDMVYVTVFVDKDCFDELELSLEDNKN